MESDLVNKWGLLHLLIIRFLIHILSDTFHCYTDNLRCVGGKKKPPGNNNANIIITSSSRQINLNFPATEAYVIFLVEPQLNMQASQYQL